MSNAIVDQLNQLDIDYKSGQTRNILYRIALLSFFFIEKSDRNEEVIKAYREWFELNKYYQIEIIESLIHMYSDNGKLIGRTPTIYSEYIELLDAYVNFLLGKDNWIPQDPRAHAEAERIANKFTAAVLEDNLMSKTSYDSAHDNI